MEQGRTREETGRDQIDRLTQANLDLQRDLRRAKQTLHDWFLGMALSGTASSTYEASSLALRAKRIADAAMRVKDGE